MTTPSLLLAAILACCALPVAATTIYADKDAWLGAVAATPVLIENFDDSTLLAGLHIIAGEYSNYVGEGVMHDSLSVDHQTVLDFSAGNQLLRAIGGQFDLSPNLPGMGLKLLLLRDGAVVEEIDTEIANSYTGQFFGLVTSTAFDSLLLKPGTQHGAAVPLNGPLQPLGSDFNYGETYQLDNLVMAAVPEPDTWAMLGGGLGLIFLRRVTRRTAAFRAAALE